jgi:hypothetical protein
MSVLFKARGTSSFGLLLIRLSLGTYTLVLGIMQASNVEAYIARVKAFGMFSENMAFIMVILPFLLFSWNALYNGTTPRQDHALQ